MHSTSKPVIGTKQQHILARRQTERVKQNKRQNKMKTQLNVSLVGIKVSNHTLRQ